MELTVKKPNSTEYCFRFEPGDENYHQCVWARITLDHDNYCLTAVTDCGEFSYQWVPTPYTESFLHLMARIDNSYLLNKISSETVFDLEASKKKTIEGIEAYLGFEDATIEELEDSSECKLVIDEINQIEDYGEELFYSKCDEICYKYNIRDTFELIEIVKNYPRGAVRFCEIFKNYLVPEIKKELQAPENK
ncbi:hypothetical protein [Anaerovorax sp. IOR16]|uniref:hypothetical protein n=1 Tax=Anaerovorax sp. IOR16 TaxID=2773458 RepID=UPI0019D1FA84|nr:hypothetical protein [Anaerovorax sp. IOR16]